MKKNFRIILGLVVVLCLLCCSVTVFAEPEIDFGDFTEAPTESVQPTEDSGDTTATPTEEPTTQEDNLVPSDYTSPDETETERVTQAPDTTRKPISANTSTTRRPSGGGNTTTTRRPDNNNSQDTAQKTTVPAEKTTVGEMVTFEADLPEGHFYVYAEKNNGTDRLKLVLDKPALIGEPSVPVRDGFIFDGWYADPQFKVRWDFYADLADVGTIIYAKWVPDPNAVVHSITVEQAEGGFISVNPDSARAGESIRITIKPDAGMRLVSGSITVNGKRIDVSSFKMPNANVVVSATFEVMPEVVEEEEEDKPILPFVIGGIALVLAIVIAAVVVSRRRDDFSEDEIDENGTIIEDDSDKSWVDESIVVSDGFVDGEKVIGTFEFDEDDEDAFPTDEE